MSKFCKFNNIFVKSASSILILMAEIAAQSPQITKPPAPVAIEEDNTWWYLSLLVLFLALAGAVYWMITKRKAEANGNDPKNSKGKSIGKKSDDKWDDDSVDAEKEMEWFRRNKKAVGKLKSPKKNFAKNLPQTSKVLKRNNTQSEMLEEGGFTAEEFKEKLEKLQYTQLPVSKFQKLELARPYSQLSISNDDALMSAIEQTQDEYEEDEEVRELAVRILARFKTRNSIEALSQVALYDLSSNLRSKAVSILADFDHESVFETILLACADPTREVRAAAARGLFRLSFDRSDAWTRIAETNDEFRMRQTTRAAIEADLVTRSFDRLIHEDYKIAYEAFTLLTLIIKADETDEIFKIFRNHREENVKLAFLQVLEIIEDERVLPKLHELSQMSGISKELKEKVDHVIEKYEMVIV